MAARLGEDGNRQALAHFVTSSPWDPAHVRARLAWKMQTELNPTALIIDDTGFLKDGDASASVSRQYTGTAGKVTNCQVGVSLHLATDRASTAVDWRLFLPKPWDPTSEKAEPAKVARRERCRIPADLGHVEKGNSPWTWSMRPAPGASTSRSSSRMPATATRWRSAWVWASAG